MVQSCADCMLEMTDKHGIMVDWIVLLALLLLRNYSICTHVQRPYISIPRRRITFVCSSRPIGVGASRDLDGPVETPQEARGFTHRQGGCLVDSSVYT